MRRETTWELRISFPNQLTGSAKKERVLDWLATYNVEGVAESVVDGVQFAADDTALKSIAEAGQESFPIAVFDFDRAKIESVRDMLHAEFGADVETTIAGLKTQAWESAWVPDFTTLSTERFFVAPTEFQNPNPKQLTTISIEAANAFGTGQHATTEAILRELEMLASTTRHPIQSLPLIDVGTGSGVLAIAAHKLGWTEIVATDIDSEVLAEARANSLRNEVEIDFRLTEAIPQDTPRFGVILVNILAPVLYRLLPQMARRLAANGRVLMTGFINEDVPGLIEASQRYGLSLLKKSDCRDWVCLTFQHSR